MAWIPIEHVHPRLPKGPLGRNPPLHDRRLIISLSRHRSATLDLLNLSHNGEGGSIAGPAGAGEVGIQTVKSAADAIK